MPAFGVMRWNLSRFIRIFAAFFIVATSVYCPALNTTALSANGSAAYTYDGLGRISSISYDTGVIVIYTYDSNGNRLTQVLNVNTLPLCLGSSAHGNPTTFGAGLLSTAAGGC